MALIRKPADFKPSQWINCLLKLDRYITGLYDDSNKIIIISLPYKFEDIKQALTEFIRQSFTQESMLFCSDAILEFIVVSKYFIHSQMTANIISNNDKPGKSNCNTWNIDYYHESISKNAIVVINTESHEFIEIPREFADVAWRSQKIISKTDALFRETCSKIFEQIGDRYLPYNFTFMDDWSDKTDFSQIPSIGYLCDNEEVAQAQCLRQSNGKIFVHFNDHAPHFGKKCAWLEVPNDRICAPPKKRPRFQAVFPKKNEATKYHNDRKIPDFPNMPMVEGQVPSRFGSRGTNQ